MKKVLLVLSIDTECDKGPAWKTQFPLSFRGVEDAIGKRLQPLFENYGVVPTYLLSPEVIRDSASVDYLGSLKQVELGTHLHAEFIEPDANFNAEVTASIQALLDPEIERRKLQNLTVLFKNTFGYSPTSFRSGRFGISQNTTKFLDELNYRVDSSITPFQRYHFPNEIVIDHWGANIVPYRVSKDNYLKPGKLSLFEVPLSSTIPPLQRLPYRVNSILGRNTKLRKHFSRKLIHLRPVKRSDLTLGEIADVIIRKWEPYSIPILNVMTHNVEYVAGLSPKSSTDVEANLLFDSLSNFLKHVFNFYEIIPVGLSTVVDYYQDLHKRA